MVAMYLCGYYEGVQPSILDFKCLEACFNARVGGASRVKKWNAGDKRSRA